MNFKKVTGFAVFVIGLVLICFALYAKNKIAGAKNTMDKMTSHVSDQPAGKMFGGMMDAKAEEYNVMVNWFLFGGIAFAVVGGSILVVCRKQKWMKK